MTNQGITIYIYMWVWIKCSFCACFFCRYNKSTKKDGRKSQINLNKIIDLVAYFKYILSFLG